MKKLSEIAAVLRKDETDFSLLKEAIEEFNQLVRQASGIELDTWENRANIYDITGMALGTTWAAMCLKDILRTKLFVQGVFEAIEKVKSEKKEPVTILYAGTGPFATLLLPVLACYHEKEVQCVLLEINTKSFQLMKELIEKLGFKKHVKAFVNEDACTYEVNSNHDIDILLSETMQRALEKEQQVPIMMHLMPQLKTEAIMIPACISLEAGLIDINEFVLQYTDPATDTYLKLGVFYELTKDSVLQWHKKNEGRKAEINFPKATFCIPTRTNSNQRELVVKTDITVFGTTKISTNESGLTTLLTLKHLTTQENPIKLHIRYKVDKQPGVVYSISQGK
jgi:predicted RNA methylase